MKQNPTDTRMARRTFLRGSLSAGAIGSVAMSCSDGLAQEDSSASDGQTKSDQVSTGSRGEVLYNGVVLPDVWPPRNMAPDVHRPMPVPYLQSPPDVIPIDVGRQLFVDDFLIEYTDSRRHFHQPVKHEANPLLSPETEVEMNQGFCPTAVPFSDGCFYDPECGHFKLYYMAGAWDGVAVATSTDGIHWERPELDVIPGTNLVLRPEKLRRDGVSVWLDHEASDPGERFKMYYWARTGVVGKKMKGGQGFILTSADGIHWMWRGEIGKTGDNSTLFYNPFRDVWAYTVRQFGRSLPPWAGELGWNGRSRGRARSYWENESLMASLGGWSEYEPVFWFGADNHDHRRPGYDLGRVPQIYKVDAVGYESLMLGLIQLHYGPPNSDCMEGGFPKLTELQLAYSRDGFHWDRANRETFIEATLEENAWDRAYIHSVGGVCNIVEDKLYFYYAGFRGDHANTNPVGHFNGMYANASTGVAVLRRDGFASMEAGREARILLTRPVTFSGEYLFVNLQSQRGAVYVEICDEDGKVLPGFSLGECRPMSTDSTQQRVGWNGGNSLNSLSGRPVRFKFHLTDSKLYAFWVSRDSDGSSGGATAAGGPGFSGTWDT